MKKTTKVLLCALCAAVLIAMSVMGTLAYLIDEEEVVNTFTVGNVDISLDEAEVDENGVPVEGADRVDGNEYHLIPGQTYVKDPTITMAAGSEEAYVRMLVTITKTAELQEIFGAEFLPETYVTGWDAEKWPCVGITDNGDNTSTYEFRYYKAVGNRDSEEDLVLEPLFTAFTLPGTVNGEQLKALAEGEGLKITVEGHAIQASMLENADAAWAAFDAQTAPTTQETQPVETTAPQVNDPAEGL